MMCYSFTEFHRKLKLMQSDRFSTLLSCMKDLKIVVIGDLIADEYIYCETNRVSREAPVLIVQYQNETLGMGGALNVVHNLASLGATVIPVGILGNDSLGNALLDMIREQKISTEGIIQRENFTTIAKTRILASSFHTTLQQVLRIDRGKLEVHESDTALLVQERALDFIDGADGVILSDYGYGDLSDKLLEHLRNKVSQKEMLVSADSRYSLPRFHGLTAITPNEPEVQKIMGLRLDSNENLIASGKQLLEHMKMKTVLITRGKMGMALFEAGKDPYFIPVYGSDEVADVSGAGDTVIATFTLALAAGASIKSAALLANYAGGIVVTRRGAATVTTNELKQAVADRHL
ncbi:bifunctional heptose 7-phosphate kinase/heptose 1-phosphate adenyltransferase [candidate division CSSED10-310 bacterium]|uniref:Bifunctional heptose 7-phosphate kinase/heptose 1-phosphate adenyltransferase n=1 Tax=candidate division CSSED10-310 bacterium TaxID=2855610 RepID=A0ABV6YX24_UNCC1